MYNEGQVELYLWEIQISEICRGKGLGQFLMKLLELVAYQNCIPQITLTVFKANEPAQIFFREKLHFVTDITDLASEDPLGNHGYDILSKQIPTKKK